MSRSRTSISALLLCLPPSIASASTSTTEMREQVIQIVTDGNWQSHTCRRVQELGKQSVSLEECNSRVDAANAQCLELARLRVPTVANADDATYLVEILMTCPIARVLGIGYVIDKRKIYIQWSELGR